VEAPGVVFRTSGILNVMANRHTLILSATLLAYLSISGVYAQDKPTEPKPDPDVLVLNDGEKLIGHFLRSNGGSVTFKSDILGELNVDWSKIKELHASERFVVVGKDVKLGRHTYTGELPKGAISMADNKIVVTGPAPGPATIPVADATHIIDEVTFNKDVLHTPGLTQGWQGSVTAGASVVEATQQARTFTGGINLLRVVPGESWLDTRDKTAIDFSASDGILTQPNTPKVKTAIYHADIQRDEYFKGSEVFSFGEASFDHNFSQGLDLQQTYSGGIGWTVIKKGNETLDLKGAVSYIRQDFLSAGQNQNLIGSTFSEALTRRFGKGVVFLQQLSATPAWNNTKAYTASGSASVTVPLYKRLNFTAGVMDSFLNDPPPAFKKNSFQLTTGLTYAFK
jgi:hypothetical protein